MTDLVKACEVFARAANILRDLDIDDKTPLRDVLPGIWPTMGDLRRLRDEWQKAGGKY